MKTINLGSEVRVSDPCYGDDVWCKTRLTSVLPGEYNVDVDVSDQGEWGRRVSSMTVTHKDYVGKNLKYQEHGDIGVDSGQAGIFCESSYRNDSIEIETPEHDFAIPFDESGDRWYEKMCKFTLSKESYGTYDTGVVATSGFGDGSYPLAVARDEDKNIVSMVITFIGEDEEDDEWDDEGDVCGVCGGELESDGECVYCCDEK